jgi:histone arginine demethylase JMJD6
MKTTQITNIDRCKNLSRKDFLNYYARHNLPVVISGAMKEWAAFNKWSPEFFRDQLGHKKTKANGRECLMRDFIETVIHSTEEKPSEYLHEVNIHTDFPELLPDITPNLIYASPDRLMSSLLPASWGYRRGVLELLIAGKGTRFPTLHYDGFHMNTFITQIKGDKDFYMYGPEQTPFMYPTTKGSNKSQVNNAFAPDLEKFPLFAQAKPMKMTVHEGETIFVPSGWWHTTKLHNISIAVSTNAVHSFQWNDFVDDYGDHLSASPLKRMIYKNYLRLAGTVMSLKGE